MPLCRHSACETHIQELSHALTHLCKSTAWDENMTKITKWQSGKTMEETETELRESEAENKPLKSLSTTFKSSSRKFTGAARYKSTFQKERTTKYKTFLRQVHGNLHAFYCTVCKKEVISVLRF